MAYPSTFTVDYGDGSRSRGLAALGVIFLKALLALPHVVVLYFVSIVALIGAWIGYIVIAFTGRQPDGITRMVLTLIVWQNRVNAWIQGLTDVYPPFSTREAHPAVTTVADDGHGERSRGWAVLGIFGLKFIAVIIQAIIVAVAGLVAGIGVYINYFAVLFTGRSMQGVHDFAGRVIDANTRIAVWLLSLTDEYPPFAL